jgi:SAM-dependent methyltransferase
MPGFLSNHKANAEEYAEKHWIKVASHLEWEHHVKRLRLAAESSIGRVLDVGCANGKATDMMRKINTACTFEGAEPTEFLYNLAVKNYPDIKFYNTFGEELPFRSSSYDTVVCMGTIEHVVDHIVLARELSRVATHRLVIGTPNVDGVDPDHKRVISESDMVKLLSIWWEKVEVVGRAKIPYLKVGDDYVVLATGKKLIPVDLETINIDRRPRIFLTTRCTYSCPTCSVRIKDEVILPEASPEKWIETINLLNASVIHVSGGEPGLYKGFAQIINGIKSKCKIFTNLSVPEEFMGIKNSRKNVLKATFYPNLADWKVFSASVKRIKEETSLEVFVYLPQWLTTLEQYKICEADLNAMGVGFSLDRNCYEEWSKELSTLNPDAPKKVFCNHRWTIIGPDCKRYPCVSKMRRGIGGIDDIRLIGSMTNCEEYGKCSCCDIELIKVYPK